MATSLPSKRAFEPSPIPDRLYFKIGDVARICGVEPYVLRFWETQFPQLRPNKSGTGQRLYRRRDVELALEIKRLVHGEGYTIPGARQALSGASRPVELQPISIAQNTELETPVTQQEPVNLAAALAEIRTGLREIAMLLAAPVASTWTTPTLVPVPVPVAIPVAAPVAAAETMPEPEPETPLAPVHRQPRRRHRRAPLEEMEIGSLFPV